MESPACIEEAHSWESVSVSEQVRKPVLLLLVLALGCGFALGTLTAGSPGPPVRDEGCLSGLQLREVAAFLAKEQEALLAVLSGQRWRGSDTRAMYQRAIALLSRLQDKEQSSGKANHQPPG